MSDEQAKGLRSFVQGLSKEEREKMAKETRMLERQSKAGKQKLNDADAAPDQPAPETMEPRRVRFSHADHDTLLNYLVDHPEARLVVYKDGVECILELTKRGDPAVLAVQKNPRRLESEHAILIQGREYDVPPETFEFLDTTTKRRFQR